MPAESVAPDVAGAGARADERGASFRVVYPQYRLAGIRLQTDFRLAPGLLDFRRTGDDWVLTLARPPVSRLEYLLELRFPDGRHEAVLDPGNSLTVQGAFGPKSVLEFPGYCPPDWLPAPAGPGTDRAVEVPAPEGVLAARIWGPAGVPDSEPLPLLVVHDGPEYDTLADLTRYLSAGLAGAWLPPLRAALLGPGPRDDWYSANPRYARALNQAIIPALTSQLATTARIGMGNSLGGLAMLHAYCRYPDAFDALFLQSGSFFMPSLDSQERWFPHYRRITRFTARLHAGGVPSRPVPVVLTCGAIEENAPNNRVMAQTLAGRGYPVTLHELSDLHNYTAWRDAFDPHLSRLLRDVCG
jgi:enterochelin esterase family protein